MSPPIGIGGYWLGGSPMGNDPGVLSHGGGSTSSVFVDLDRRLSVAICQNRTFADVPRGAEHPFSALASAINAAVSEAYGVNR